MVAGAEKTLHVCLLGDAGVGCRSLLQCYLGLEGEEGRKHESFVICTDVENEKYHVRFSDAGLSPCFASLGVPLLRSAHVFLLCFSVADAVSLDSVKLRWLPLVQSVGATAPVIILGLQADRRSNHVDCTSEDEMHEFARQCDAVAYHECSSRDMSTVRAVLAEVLSTARNHNAKAPQLECEDLDGSVDTSWLFHETLLVEDDTSPLNVETVRKNLSVLGLTPLRTHAYLRVDLTSLGLTSLDPIRDFQHLQFVNISSNRLRSLEPLGSLHCLLHLNASFNLLVRTDFTAPDQLETVDMSFNMIGDLGNWSVHKHLHELNLRGNFICAIGRGLSTNGELRTLDVSCNRIPRIEHLDGLDLRVLLLAQNRLTSLEGVGSCTKLHVLNVRHNCIVSVGALRSEDLPRLRKLSLAENRISTVTEVESLCSFPFLCELELLPNPIMNLPYYRAQVLHRLPSLRSLDEQPVSAEEKVKACVIYGADVEKRRAIFAGLLPGEEFVDRRLVTVESMEKEELVDTKEHAAESPNSEMYHSSTSSAFG